MARPLKNNLAWFKHDTKARTDLKLGRMIAKHGLAGYGFFFAMLEIIYDTDDQALVIADEETRDLIAYDLRIDRATFDSYLEAALRCGLFDRAAFDVDGLLTSSAISERAAALRERREKMREKRTNVPNSSAQSTVGDERTTASATQSGVCDEQTVCDAQTPVSGEQVLTSRVEKSRVEKRGVEKRGGSEDARTHVRENGHAEAQEDPSVVATRLPDGTVLVNAPDLAGSILTAYHLPDCMRAPILAWIETHDSKAPSAHDAKALRIRVDQSNEATVTRAIRTLGNKGRRSIESLDEILNPMIRRLRNGGSQATDAAEQRPAPTVEERSPPPADPEAEEAARRADEAYATELRARQSKRAAPRSQNPGSSASSPPTPSSAPP